MWKSRIRRPWRENEKTMIPEPHLDPREVFLACSASAYNSSF